MEDHIHPQRNFRLSNNFRRSSTCQFPPPTEINNPNLPENFYDLVAELDQLTLSTPAPHGGQFLDHKNLTASQQPYSAFPGGGGSSGGSTVLGRIGSINGGGGGSTNYGPFVDSGHIPIPSSSLRYGDLQRMRVESAVRGQQMAAMYMQLHGYANPIEEANFRGFNFHPLNSNAAAQAFNLHGLNSNTRELENLYSLYNGGGGGGNQSLVRAGDGGSGFNGFHEFMINPSNPIMRTNGINRFDANRIRSRSNNNFSAEYENHRSRQSNYNFTSLEELKGRIYLVAKDQNGCRFLQKIVEEGKPEEFQMIYSEIKEHDEGNAEIAGVSEHSRAKVVFDISFS
ncbi:hypothetical protein M9H77_20489 [Catharanthus roseus]|uniref:Uncharacterized protein n=1 Tax=Catharanthus roseus TaxID=4058 RepID=A0ACC0AKC1_CATRO|nr:hypothetical protein M9H77_20489 [Catharanthus roseus]